MIKGIVFGLLYNVVVAIGLVTIANVHTIKNDVLKSGFMLLIAGSVATIVAMTIFLVDKTQVEQFKLLDKSNLIQIGIGSILVLVIGEALYISGLSASSATVMGYSALAYPATALIVEIAFKRVEFSSLTSKDLIGFAFLALGFILIASRK